MDGWDGTDNYTLCTEFIKARGLIIMNRNFAAYRSKQFYY